MACCGNSADYLPANSGYIPGTTTRVLSHKDCDGVTVDFLNMLHRLVKCVKTHSIYAQVKVTEAEINLADGLLTNWIAIKNVDPKACDHQEQLPIIQNIVNKIVAYGQC